MCHSKEVDDNVLNVCFGKVKVKLFLHLINYAPHHKDAWGISPPFLTSALDGGEWSAL
jgi:hypothetical protein